MSENYYQSVFDGPQIDNAIGRIASGEIDQLAKNASTSAAEAEKAKTAAQSAQAGAENAKQAAQSALSGIEDAIDNIPAGSTPIVNDLTTGGATMALSAEMGKVLGRRPNPNLLHNWYFGDPVDQRGGYVVPPGAAYYTMAWEPVGVTDKYYPVLLRRDAANNYDCEIDVNGVRYVVGGLDAVRGYAGAGYTIDRWRLLFGGAVILNNDGIRLVSGPTSDPTCFDFVIDATKLRGQTVTLSALISCDDPSNPLYLSEADNLAVNHADVSTANGGITVHTFTVPDDASVGCVRIWGRASGSGVIRAIKLELGSVQTLAHQDASGEWVLNEIPDKNEELLKCCMSTADSSDTYANNQKTAAAVGAVQSKAFYTIGTDTTILKTICDYSTRGIYSGQFLAADNVADNPATNWAFAIEFVNVGGNTVSVRAHKLYTNIIYCRQIDLNTGAYISNWGSLATTDTALMRDGSNAMTGALYLDDWGSGTHRTMLTTHDNRTHLRHEGDNSDSVALLLSMEEEMLFAINKNGGYNNYPILHTGNVDTLGVARIVHGTYTGTGTSGEANPNTLTFDFTPKILILCGTADTAHMGYSTPSSAVLVWGVTDTLRTSQYHNNHVSYNGNTVSWYHTDTTANTPSGGQLNSAGAVYHYIAFA